MPYTPSEFPGALISVYAPRSAPVVHRNGNNGHLLCYILQRIGADDIARLEESSDDGATWTGSSIPLTGINPVYKNAGTPLAVSERPDGSVIVVSALVGYIMYNERNAAGSWGTWLNVSSLLGAADGTSLTPGQALIDDNYFVYISSPYNTISLVSNETGTWTRSDIPPYRVPASRGFATQGGLLKASDGTLIFTFRGGSSAILLRPYCTRRDPITKVWDTAVYLSPGVTMDITPSTVWADIHRGPFGDRYYVMYSYQAGSSFPSTYRVVVSDDLGLTFYSNIVEPGTSGTFIESFYGLSRYYVQLIGLGTNAGATRSLKIEYFTLGEDRVLISWGQRFAGPGDSVFSPSAPFVNHTLSGRGQDRWRILLRSYNKPEHISANYATYFSSGLPDAPVGVESLGSFSQFLIEAETDSILPVISQFLLEIDVQSSGGSVQVSQFLLEIEASRLLLSPDISQFLIEVEDTGMDVSTGQGDFLLMANVKAPVIGPPADPITGIVHNWFMLSAKVKPVAQHGGIFNLEAKIVDPVLDELPEPPPGTVYNWFLLAAKVKSIPVLPIIPNPDPLITTWTDYYQDFDGPYEVRLLNHDGTLVRVLEKFQHFEFVRAINGKQHSGYGSFQYLAAADLTHMDEFILDRIMQVRRICTVGPPVVVFEGLVRYTSVTVGTDHKKIFVCTGPDLKHLMKRRIIIPPTGSAFASFNKPFTDIMRSLVSQNASIFAPGARFMYRVQPYIYDSYGVWLNLHYRYTRLSDELDQLANVEEGADWEVVQQGDAIYFKVHYLFKGKDRRRNSQQGWPEMVWSLDRGNVVSPTYVEDRVNEVTMTIVGGEGVGVDREIIVRASVADRQYNSPWNRSEEFIDASSETSEAALKAQGDANNVDHGMVRAFSVQATQAQLLSYGKKWNLGDLCIGEFDAGGVFEMRVVEVREVLDPTENHLAVYPTFFVYPRLGDY